MSESTDIDCKQFANYNHLSSYLRECYFLLRIYGSVDRLIGVCSKAFAQLTWSEICIIAIAKSQKRPPNRHFAYCTKAHKQDANPFLYFACQINNPRPRFNELFTCEYTQQHSAIVFNLYFMVRSRHSYDCEIAHIVNKVVKYIVG